MKRTFTIFAVLTVVLSFSFSSVFAQIHSTVHGGTWNDTLTWVGYKVPGPNDDVVIEGTVDVTGAECNNLAIMPGGVIQNRSYTNYTLKVNGSVTNSGTIRDYPDWYHLWITVEGDIINNGEWSNQYTYLVGESDHVLNFTKEFSGYKLEVINPSGRGTLIANTDLTFKNTKVDLKGGTLRLPQGGKLYVYGEWMYNGKIIGDNSELFLYDNAFFERVTLDNVILKGLVNIFSSVVLDEEPVVEID